MDQTEEDIKCACNHLTSFTVVQVCTYIYPPLSFLCVCIYMLCVMCCATLTASPAVPPVCRSRAKRRPTVVSKLRLRMWPSLQHPQWWQRLLSLEEQWRLSLSSSPCNGEPTTILCMLSKAPASHACNNSHTPHRRTRVRRPVSIHDNDTEMMYVNEVANTDI